MFGVSMLAPLNTSLGFIKITTWNLPGALLVFWIVLRGANRSRFKIINFDLWDYSILASVFLYYLMTLLGQDPIESLLGLNGYAYCLLLAIYFRRSYGKVFNMKTLIIYAFITVLLQSFFGILQQVTSSEIGNISIYFGDAPATMELRSVGDTDMGRIHGTLGTGNLVGSWICMFTPFIIFSADRFKRKNFILLIMITLILATITILLTISRFNIALYILVLGTAGLYTLKSVDFSRVSLKVKTVPTIFVLFLFLMSIGMAVRFRAEIALMRQAIEIRFSDTFEQAAEAAQITSGVAARMEMNKGAIQAFARSPIIGLGFKNSRSIWPTVDAKVPPNWAYQPHNVYMVVLVEGGFFLFLGYSLLTLLPFFRMWQARKNKDPMMIALFLSLSAALGIHMMYITFTSPSFTAVYTALLGTSMGYLDNYFGTKGTT